MTYHNLRWFLALVLFSFSGSLSYAQPSSFAPLVKSERDKVVYISTTSQTKIKLNPWLRRAPGAQPKPHKEQALGSGFIISSDGLILTNNHVVAKADKIEVTLFNKKTYQAEVIGTDPRTDLGLLKIKATGLPFVRFGDSDKVEVGDWVIAIGNPLGLDHSVTAGILSARGRDIFSGTAYGQFLQTDAAINPGNSGGPLFTVDGKVIGINTAIISGGQGLGFAVPSNLAQKVIAQLREHGFVERGWLGIGIQEVSPALAGPMGLPEETDGIAVTAVQPGSPAEKAGLKQGDVITHVNGKATTSLTSLQQVIAEEKPGKVVRLKLFRNGKKLQLPVKLGKNKRDVATKVEETAPTHRDMELVALTPQIAQQSGVHYQKGVLVKQVMPDSTAAEAGMRQGDVILSVNRQPVDKPKSFYRLLQRSKGDTALLLVARRDGQAFIGLPKK